MTRQPAFHVRHAAGQYPVWIDAAWLDEIGERIASENSNCFVITDENVEALHGTALTRLWKTHADVLIHSLPPGEDSKCLDVAKQVYDELLNHRIDRQGTIVALGGGVVGDLAGFVAATWMRGIPLIQIPTTLVAQVDSSIGGKTGVNLTGGKNMVGSFWQPRSVYMDTALLKTLDDHEYTSGLAEVVKYGVVLDAELFGFLESHVAEINARDETILVDIVRRCGRLKAQVVEEDERETLGRRAVLNYGHTFGHAIETVFGYGTWRHGHAVAMGMMAAARLAESLGMVASGLAERQARLLAALRIPCDFPRERHDELLEVMKRDKKARNGRPVFVLPVGPGVARLSDPIETECIARAMREA